MLPSPAGMQAGLGMSWKLMSQGCQQPIYRAEQPAKETLEF